MTEDGVIWGEYNFITVISPDLWYNFIASHACVLIKSAVISRTHMVALGLLITRQRIEWSTLALCQPVNEPTWFTIWLPLIQTSYLDVASAQRWNGNIVARSDHDSYVTYGTVAFVISRRYFTAPARSALHEALRLNPFGRRRGVTTVTIVVTLTHEW